MLLAVDIGNTNMEFGIFERNQLKASFRLATHHDVTSDELGLSIRQFFLIHGIDLSTLEDVLISSVVPQVIYSVKNAMRKYLGIEPMIVQENFNINIVNRYDNPAEVGACLLYTSILQRLPKLNPVQNFHRGVCLLLF